MAGISHNAKNSNLPEFGDSVSGGSKALCGLTEAAAQVKSLLLLLLYIRDNMENAGKVCVLVVFIIFALHL